jgi:hypothetical protein
MLSLLFAMTVTVTASGLTRDTLSSTYELMFMTKILSSQFYIDYIDCTPMTCSNNTVLQHLMQLK